MISKPICRYHLLDYFYTAFHKASVNGSPIVNPLWFKYLTDTATFGSIYLPKDKFYDFATFSPVEGTGQTSRR